MTEVGLSARLLARGSCESAGCTPAGAVHEEAGTAHVTVRRVLVDEV